MKPYIYLTGYCFLLIFAGTTAGFAQKSEGSDLQLVRIHSGYTAFPDQNRVAGYTNDGRFFDAASHYSDSSVLLVYSSQLSIKEKLNIVFWFHGWYNNIDTALHFYQLAEQWKKANPQAVLVLAETAKNAADSYGGKLEQPQIFKGLVQDIMQVLIKEKAIPASTKLGNIVLAGHSGAYRVIAHILQYGGTPVQEVDLFDALYCQTDKFLQWISINHSNRLINWYTNHGGGTDEVSLQMMADLKKSDTPFLLAEEKELVLTTLQQNRILFVHTDREHNDIINNPDNFSLLLTASPFLKINKQIP